MKVYIYYACIHIFVSYIIHFLIVWCGDPIFPLSQQRLPSYQVNITVKLYFIAWAGPGPQPTNNNITYNDTIE